MVTEKQHSFRKLLVCNGLADGCVVASNLRDCTQCGTQLWVATFMTPLVESGKLRPICWPCQRKTGQPVTIHLREIQVLTELGRLDEGWRIIGEMNSHD
jgi:hypothetical protein